MWCGDESCEEMIKTETGGAGSRCLIEDEEPIPIAAYVAENRLSIKFFWGKA